MKVKLADSRHVNDQKGHERLIILHMLAVI